LCTCLLLCPVTSLNAKGTLFLAGYIPGTGILDGFFNNVVKNASLDENEDLQIDDPLPLRIASASATLVRFLVETRYIQLLKPLDLPFAAYLLELIITYPT